MVAWTIKAVTAFILLCTASALAAQPASHSLDLPSRSHPNFERAKPDPLSRQPGDAHSPKPRRRVFIPGFYYVPEFEDSPSDDTDETSSAPKLPPLTAGHFAPPVPETVRLPRRATTPKGFSAAPKDSSSSRFVHIPGAFSAPKK